MKIEETLRTPFPGIMIMTGDFFHLGANEREFERTIQHHYNQPLKPYCKIKLGNWLIAYGFSRQASENNYYTDDTGVSVIFDGYVSKLSGLNNNSCNLNTPYARTIAKLYSDSGVAFIKGLGGSFLCLIVDHNQNKAYLFNDRQGSRPMFSHSINDASIFFAPQVKFISSISQQSNQLNASAVGQFLIRGCFYGNDTIYDNIYKFPQANIVTFTENKQISEHYWTFKFNSSLKIDNEDELLEKFDELLSSATRRLLDVVDKPTLLLSGGLDSRLMLAYLVKEGADKIPALSYKVHNTKGEDHIIARQLADYCGLQHETYEIHEDDYIAIAMKEVLAVDGRVQVLDSPSNRWEHIGKTAQSIFIGDECFGWGKTVDSVSEALNVVGWFNLDKTHRISDWLKPEFHRKIFKEIKHIQKRLIVETGETDPNNIKDKLYYTERMGNMLNGYGARRLWLMEQARPFLDEDIIDFISGLTAEQRQDKFLAWKVMAAKFPELNSIPYSQGDSVPWWPPQFIQITKKNRALYNFIVENLTENLHPQLAELFDQQRLNETIPAIFNNESMPVLRNEWWTRFPGMWRFSQERYDKVGAVRSALRLLGLNLYLHG